MLSLHRVASLLFLVLAVVSSKVLAYQTAGLPDSLEPILARNVTRLVNVFSVDAETPHFVWAFVSSESALITTSRDNHHIQIWRFEGNQVEQFQLRGHSDRVTYVTLDETNSILVSKSRDNAIRLWKLDNREELNRVTGTGRWYDLAFSSRTNQLAFGIGYGEIYLFDLENSIKRTLHESGVLWSVTSLDFDPTGKMLASANFVGVRIWDLDKGKVAQHVSEVRATNFVTFSRSGELLAMHTDNGFNFVWDVNQEALVAMRQSIDDPSYFNIVAFSDDETVLAGQSRIETEIRFWNTRNGDLLATMTFASPILGFAFSTDGTLLATGHDDGVLRLWGVPSD